MKIDETMIQTIDESEDHRDDLLEMAIEEGHAENLEEAAVFLDESLAQTIKTHVGNYRGRNAPEISAFQDPSDRNHVAVLSASDNMFFRFDVMNGRVVSEERYDSFKEMMEERELLVQQRFYKIDHRSFFSKHWKKILMSMVGVFFGGPLLVAAIAASAPAAVTAMAGYTKVAALGAGIAGGGWLLNRLGKASETKRA